MSTTSLAQKCNQILGQREDIPGAPLWHMGKVAAFNSKESLDLIQNSIDYLSCKARFQKPFTSDEKEFMKEIFEALWWGGQYKGYKEAAKLANHYVNGNGKSIQLNEDVYRNSVIVIDTVNALKRYIKTLSANKKSFLLIKSSDPHFLASPNAAALNINKRNIYNQGYLLKDGALLVEQKNQRLKNADHRFMIQAHTTTSKTKGKTVYVSKWTISSVYDFEPFSSKDYVTNIPLAENLVLKIPDGLSHYLSIIGVANDFIYNSGWIDTWE